MVTCFLIAQNLPDIRRNSEQLQTRLGEHQERCHNSDLTEGEKLNLADSDRAWHDRNVGICRA